ncbi:MAG TPA: copper resistance CopC family protein [Micromonosporaceae bacterium]|nr:copper resistance CopC family protein [Micromonosporaceae bacterium]
MRGSSFRVGRALMAVVVGVLAGAIAAGPAWAHNALASSNPPNGARLAKAPAAVRLTFLARLDPATTWVTVTGPDGASAAAGRPAFDRATVRVPLRAAAAGIYTVAYRVTSEDGHPVQGQIQFKLTVAAAPSASPSASPTPSPSASPSPVAPSTRQAEPTLAPAASDTDDGGTPWWPWAAAGAAVALLAAGVGAVLARRR